MEEAKTESIKKKPNKKKVMKSTQTLIERAILLCGRTNRKGDDAYVEKLSEQNSDDD